MRNILIGLVLVSVIIGAIIYGASEHLKYNVYLSKTQEVTFSTVCDNINYYATNRYHSISKQGTGEEENITFHTDYWYKYVDGIVVYSEWKSDKHAGIIAITGEKQIKTKDTESVVAIYTERKSQIENYKVGTIVSLKTPSWKSNTHEGKLYRFVYKPYGEIEKTGFVNAEDPDYTEIFNAMRDYETDLDNDAMFLMLFIIVIMPMMMGD